jgi:predicted GNAT family N-acyltransferase
MELLEFTGTNNKYFPLAMQVRKIVFVEEQKVPEELERDEHDFISQHVLLCEEEQPIATGRIFVDPEDLSIARLGRVAVLASFRGRGLGRMLIEKLIKKGQRLNATRIIIHAQLQVEQLYALFGFKKSGPEHE